MTLQFGEPVDPRVPWIRKLADLDGARATHGTGLRQEAVERAGKLLGDRLRQGPKVVSVRTLPTSRAPYPVRFAFNGTVPAIAKDDPDFYQTFPSSEVSRSLLAPHIAPTHVFGKMESGVVELRQSAARAPSARVAVAP